MSCDEPSGRASRCVVNSSGGWMLSAQISLTYASRASIICRFMGRTSPASDTLKISAPPNVLPNAASSFATLSRRGSQTRVAVKRTSMNSTRLSSPSASCFSSLPASQSTTVCTPAARSTETRLCAVGSVTSSTLASVARRPRNHFWSSRGIHTYGGGQKAKLASLRGPTRSRREGCVPPRPLDTWPTFPQDRRLAAP